MKVETENMHTMLFDKGGPEMMAIATYPPNYILKEPSTAAMRRRSRCFGPHLLRRRDISSHVGSLLCNVVIRWHVIPRTHEGHSTCSSGDHQPLILELISRHNINKEIKYIGPTYGCSYVILLQSSSLVLLGVNP